MTELNDWSSFYVIVGSSAGALIGLQFVVLTLIAARPTSGDSKAGAAFATPSVVHFGVVLLIAAVISAPWKAVGVLAVLWGVLGAGGIAYSFVVAARMRAQNAYRPVFEDWLFHILLPLAAYTMLAVSAYLSRSSERPALFVVGAATLVFLFVGIHNAWDAITWHVFARKAGEAKTKRKH
jgi:hypothetical protein